MSEIEEKTIGKSKINIRVVTGLEERACVVLPEGKLDLRWETYSEEVFLKFYGFWCVAIEEGNLYLRDSTGAIWRLSNHKAERVPAVPEAGVLMPDDAYDHAAIVDDEGSPVWLGSKGLNPSEKDAYEKIKGTQTFDLSKIA